MINSSKKHPVMDRVLPRIIILLPIIGDAMCGYGRRLQDFESGNVYASALVEMGNILISRIFLKKIFCNIILISRIYLGECMKQMADYKYALDDNVKQNYLEPMHHTQTKDLR